MKTIIKKNDSKISGETINYQQSVRVANQLFEAFTAGGYQMNDTQAKEMLQRGFSKESLQDFAETLVTAKAPTERVKELQAVTSDLYATILQAVPGWELSYISFHNVEIKNLKAVENPKIIKEIEDSHTIFAEGQCKEVYDRLQHISAELNLLMPQLKKSVFNRRLQASHLFIEQDGKIIPNIDIIDFTDL